MVFVTGLEIFLSWHMIYKHVFEYYRGPMLTFLTRLCVFVQLFIALRHILELVGSTFFTLHDGFLFLNPLHFFYSHHQ